MTVKPIKIGCSVTVAWDGVPEDKWVDGIVVDRFVSEGVDKIAIQPFGWGANELMAAKVADVVDVFGFC